MIRRYFSKYTGEQIDEAIGAIIENNIRLGDLSPELVEDIRQWIIDRTESEEMRQMYVTASGDQIIQGVKTFASRPKIWTETLPNEYQEVEYIASSGKEYINTEFIPRVNTTARLKVKITTLTRDTADILSSMDTTSFKRYVFAYLDHQNKLQCDFGYSTLNCNKGEAIEKGGVYTIESRMGSNLQTFKINESSYSTSHDYSNVKPREPLYLFARNNAGNTESYFAGAIYYCEIYDRGTLVRQFIPCYRVKDNVAGLYDTVTKKFYGNLGEGGFAYGPEVSNMTGLSEVATLRDIPSLESYFNLEDNETVLGQTTFIKRPIITSGERLPEGYQELEYIESTGSQYINTQFIPTSKTRAVIDMELTALGNAAFFGSRNTASATDGNSYFAWFIKSGDSYTIRSDYMGLGTAKIVNIEIGDRFTIDKNAHVTALINETQSTSMSWSDKESTTNGTKPLYVFAGNNGGDLIWPTTGKLYSFKLYNGSTLIKDYVPCYDKENGKAGVYDLVNGEFISSVGAADFISGPQVKAFSAEAATLQDIPSLDRYFHIDCDNMVYGTTTFINRPQLQTRFIPTEYQEVEYLWSDGTQHIDSQLYYQPGIKIIAEFEPTEFIDKYPKVFGTESSSNVETFKVDIRNGKMQFGYGSSEYATTVQTTLDTRYLIEVQDNVLYINGKQEAVGVYGDLPNRTYPIYIFASNRAGEIKENSAIKLYSFKTYVGNNLTRYYIPCYRKEDGKPGLFDVITQTFYTNAKEGVSDFRFGSVVNNPTTASSMATVDDIPTRLSELANDMEFVNKTSPETITGVKTFTNGIKVGQNAISMDSSNRINLYNGSDSKLRIGSTETIIKTNLTPDSTDSFTLGRKGLEWGKLWVKSGLSTAVDDGVDAEGKPQTKEYNVKITDIVTTNTDQEISGKKTFTKQAVFAPNEGALIKGAGKKTDSGGDWKIYTDPTYGQLRIEETNSGFKYTLNNREFYGSGVTLGSMYYPWSKIWITNTISTPIDTVDAEGKSKKEEYSIKVTDIANKNDYYTKAEADAKHTEVVEVAEGKTKTYVLSAEDATEGSSNSLLKSNNDLVEIDITENSFVVLTDGSQLKLQNLNIGQIILVTEVGYPDRFVDITGRYEDGSISKIGFRILESRKMDLDSYVDKTSEQTISGRKTWMENIIRGDASGRYLTIGESNKPWDKAFITYLNSPWSGCTFGPQYSNQYNLGTSERLWKNLYLIGNLSDGTNSTTIANIAVKNANNEFTTTQKITGSDDTVLNLHATHATWSNIAFFTGSTRVGNIGIKEQKPCWWGLNQNSDYLALDGDVVHSTGDEVISGKKVFYEIPTVAVESLPIEYQEVEYIESTGTQYIDTGVVPNDNTQWELTFQMTATEGTRINGRYDNGIPTARFDIGMINGSTWFLGVGTDISVGTVDTNKHTVVLDSKNYTAEFDGTIYDIPKGTMTSIYSVYLFARNVSGDTSYYCNEKIYSSKLHQNGELVRNFIPCYRKSDNMAGLYDLVNNEFYSNNGDGAFGVGQNIFKGESVALDSEVVHSTGNEVVDGIKTFNERPYVNDLCGRLPSKYQEVEYIEATGTQYIDAGFKTTSEKLKIEFACSFPRGMRGLSLMGSSYPYNLVPYGTGDNIISHWVGSSVGIMPVIYDSNYNEVVYNLNNGTISCAINGNINTATYDGTIKNDYNFYVFGKNNNGSSSERANGYRLYYMKIYVDDILIRDFIPSYNKDDNSVGLYDLVTKTFFTNQGTGTILYGNPVSRTARVSVALTSDLENLVSRNEDQVISGRKTFTETPVVLAQSLPSEYQAIEYIESTGTQYIDTEVNLSDDSFEIESDFSQSVKDTKEQHIFSIWTSTYNYWTVFIRSGVVSCYTTKHNYSGQTIEENQKYKIVLTRNGGSWSMDINGTQNSFLYTPTTINPTTLKLLIQGDLGEPNAQIKLYSFKLKQKGTLTRDFMPCYRKSDNAVGLYDFVGKKFYESKGTGTFKMGNEVELSQQTTEVALVNNVVNITDNQEISGTKTFKERPLLPLNVANPTHVINQYVSVKVEPWTSPSAVSAYQDEDGIHFSGEATGYWTYRFSLDKVIPVGHKILFIHKYTNKLNSDFGVRVRDSSSNLSYAGPASEAVVTTITDVPYLEWYGSKGTYDVTVTRIELYDLTEIFDGNENIPGNVTSDTIEGLSEYNKQAATLNDLLNCYPEIIDLTE